MTLQVRYIELLKNSLLNEPYLENEVRLLYIFHDAGNPEEGGCGCGSGDWAALAGLGETGQASPAGGTSLVDGYFDRWQWLSPKKSIYATSASFRTLWLAASGWTISPIVWISFAPKMYRVT